MFLCGVGSVWLLFPHILHEASAFCSLLGSPTPFSLPFLSETLVFAVLQLFSVFKQPTMSKKVRKWALSADCVIANGRVSVWIVLTVKYVQGDSQRLQ